MLNQGPASDPRYELNITSFLILSHALRCLICAKDIMVTLLLLQVIGVGKVWGWFIYARVWVGEQGVGIIFSLFCVLFFCCC